MEERFDAGKDNEKLATILIGLKNQVVDVIVRGGWLFTGKLSAIEDELIVLCDVTVTSSGGLTFSTFDVEHVTICLESVISAGKPVLLL